MTIPDERITLDNFLTIIKSGLQSEIMKQYLLRDLDTYQINHVYYRIGITSYYGNEFYNELICLY